MKTSLSFCFIVMFSIFTSVNMTEKELSSIHKDDKKIEQQSYQLTKIEAKQKLASFVSNQQQIKQNISKAKENIATIKYAQSN